MAGWNRSPVMAKSSAPTTAQRGTAASLRTKEAAEIAKKMTSYRQPAPVAVRAQQNRENANRTNLAQAAQQKMTSYRQPAPVAVEAYEARRQAQADHDAEIMRSYHIPYEAPAPAPAPTPVYTGTGSGRSRVSGGGGGGGAAIAPAAAMVSQSIEAPPAAVQPPSIVADAGASEVNVPGESFTSMGSPGSFGAYERRRANRGPRTGMSVTPEMIRRAAASRMG